MKNHLKFQASRLTRASLNVWFKVALKLVYRVHFESGLCAPGGHFPLYFVVTWVNHVFFNGYLPSNYDLGRPF